MMLFYTGPCCACCVKTPTSPHNPPAVCFLSVRHTWDVEVSFLALSLLPHQHGDHYGLSIAVLILCPFVFSSVTGNFGYVDGLQHR